MARWQGQKDHGLPNFFEIILFLAILLFCQIFFRHLLLVKIKVLKCIRKSLNLPCLLCRCHDASDYRVLQYIDECVD